MKKISTLLVILSSSLFASLPVFAWYQVEMIVFEYVNPDTGNEYWDTEPGLPPLFDSVIPVPEILHEATLVEGDDMLMEKPPPRVTPYMLLAANKYRLQGVMQALRQSREYRPLYHTSWQQPPVDGNRARAMHIQVEDASKNLFELTLPPILADESVLTDFYEPIQLLLDGIIRVRSSTFLHIDVDMVLFRQPTHTIPLAALDGSAVSVTTERAPSYIRLQETRRIRLNDLHYFDHPLFGVIVQVSRYAPD
jgi:hypothetical protein